MAPPSATLDLSGGRQFTGKELDDTGYYDFGARYYDPTSGRYLQPDNIVPSSTPQAFNRYSYALGNPLRYVDPSGHEPWTTAQYRANQEKQYWQRYNALSPQQKAALAAEDRAEVQASAQDKAPWLDEAKFSVFGFLGFNNWARAYTGENEYGHELSLDDRVWEFTSGTGQIVLNAMTVQGVVEESIAQWAARGRQLRAQAAAIEYANTFPRSAKFGGPRSVTAMETVSGETFLGGSRSGVSHTPKVQAALDKVPDYLRSPFHGLCGEMNCLSNAERAGAEVEGAFITATKIRGPNSLEHGTPHAACSSCRFVQDELKVQYQ